MSGRSTSKINSVINYLSQKVIDAESEGREIIDSGENNLPENIDTFDIVQMRDLGTRSTLKTAGNIYRMVEGADNGQTLRAWVKFSNAAKLYDYSKNNLQSFTYGLRQIPILNFKKVSSNVLGWEFQSFFNGNDQYAYTDDHEKIRISEMFADSNITHISFFDSFTPVSIARQIGAETSVLFEKIDDDQLKDGYALTMNDKGDLFFYIRRDFKQYSYFLKGIYADQVLDELQNAGDFNAANFNPDNFHTDLEYTTNLICSTEKTDDHWFVFNKSNNTLNYILNGITYVYDKLSVSPVLDVPFQDGAYNTDGSDRTQIHDISGNDYHGTLSNPENGQWQTNNTFFNFGSNTAGNGGGCRTTFPTITSLDSANDFTISFMYKPDNIINTNSWFETIITKNWQVDGSFIIYRPPNSGNITAEYRDPTGIKRSVSVVGGVTTTEWHSIILKCERSQPMKFIIDGVTYNGSVALPATALTSTGVLELGNVNTGLRGTVCYLRVFDSALSTIDAQLLFDEGYHNPTFPKSEKPQPEPVENPDLITNPFEVFYNLATEQPTINIANTVWLNSIAGDSPFTEFYNVADGVDESFPEEAIYDVIDGDTGGEEDPFVERYNCVSGENSSVQLAEDEDNATAAVKITESFSSLIGHKITRAIFELKPESTPNGTVYCRVWDNNGNIVTTLDSIDASSLNSDGNWHEYTFTNTNTTPYPSNGVQLNWRIGIQYDTGSSTSDKVHVRRITSNPKSGEMQDSRDYSGNWSTNSNNDIAGRLYSGGGTTASDPFIYMEYVQKIGGGSSNTYKYDRIMEKFGSGDNCLTQIPTKIKVKMKKTGSGHSGTIRCYLCSGHTGSVIEAEFAGSIAAASVSTTSTEYTFTLPTNTESITNGWNIMIFWENMPSSSTAKIGVMTNTGVSDPHNGTASHVMKYGYVPGFENLANHLLNYTTIDVSGQIYIGGNEFDADIEFTASRTRIYIKGTSVSSAVVGKKLTKAIFRAKRTGTPTGQITVNVRDNDGNNTVRFSLGSKDVSLISNVDYEDLEFLNVFQTLQIDVNDRICVEYLGADASNYIELRINKDVFQTTNTIGGTYSSPSNTDNAQIDISGKLYIGGEPDVNSRIRVGQKIAVDNQSILDGEKLTKIGVWLINPDAVLGNINCIVFRGSDDTPIVTIGSPVAASTIGTEYEYVEFENVNNGYVLNVNDKVCIVFEGGSTSQRIGVHVRENTNYDTDKSHVVRFNGQEYDDMLTWDLVATMWTGGDTFQPPPFAQPDPTPTNNKALLYCAGNNLLSGFARVLQREFMLYTKEITTQMALNKYTNRFSITSRSPSEVLTAGLFRPY